MEKKYSKKTLAVTLSAALAGMLGASPLAFADNTDSAPAEPAPATEPASDAAAAPADAAATSAPADAAPADAAPADAAAPATP